MITKGDLLGLTVEASSAGIGAAILEAVEHLQARGLHEAAGALLDDHDGIAMRARARMVTDITRKQLKPRSPPG